LLSFFACAFGEELSDLLGVGSFGQESVSRITTAKGTINKFGGYNRRKKVNGRERVGDQKALETMFSRGVVLDQF